MKYRRYGPLAVDVSRIGFGGWQLGNEHSWGTMSFEYGVSLVKEAFSRGVNFFDTAPNYAGGLSEKIIGTALKDVRDKVVINTKVGHSPDGVIDFSLDYLMQSVNGSLERLQTTYLDSLILHNPPFEILEGKTGHFDVLEALKQKGIIRAYGVSIDTAHELRTVIENTQCKVVEILFNVFFQDAKNAFKLAQEKGIALIIKVPLDSGWLTGKYDASSRFTGIRERWDQATIARRAELVDKLKSIINDPNLTMYALAYILKFEAVTTVIPGIRSTMQLDDAISNESFTIPNAVFNAFNDLYASEIEPSPLPW